MPIEIRYFTHYYSDEQFLASYEYDSPVSIIPREKERVMINGDIYVVKRVCNIHDEEIPDKQLIEIMLEEIDYNKDWWE